MVVSYLFYLKDRILLATRSERSLSNTDSFSSPVSLQSSVSVGPNHADFVVWTWRPDLQKKQHETIVFVQIRCTSEYLENVEDERRMLSMKLYRNLPKDTKPPCCKRSTQADPQGRHEDSQLRRGSFHGRAAGILLTEGPSGRSPEKRGRRTL